MRLVEFLARHFDKTRASDRPEVTTLDTLREVESIDRPQSPDMAPDITPDVSPVAIPERSVKDTDNTAKKISELTHQVLGAERRNEQRLAAVTKVLTALANRLQLSSDSAAAVDPIGRDEPRDGSEEDAAQLPKAEIVFWESIRDSEDFGDYESYLESFPYGLFATLARRRAARETVNDSGGPQPLPGLNPTAPSPAGSVPRLDYDTLNERAIENTKRGAGEVAPLDTP